MRKVLPILLVIAIAVPALADVTVTATNEGVSGSGQVKITIAPTGGAEVRGVALLLTIETGDAVIDDDGDAVATGLNTNIDYFFTNGTGMVGGETPVSSDGHPLADPTQAGVLDPTGGVGTFSLSSGYLDAGGGQAGYAVDSFFDITYTLSVDSTLQVELDSLRGGIVGDNLGTITVVNGDGNELLIPGAPPECMAATNPDYADWTSYSKPDCWCYQKQCRGDADGLDEFGFPVLSNDLAILAASYAQADGSGTFNICADFDRTAEFGFRVLSGDLSILAGNYATQPLDCADGAAVPNSLYNFWTN